MERLQCSAAVLVVVRRGDKILAIQESGHQQAWFPPAGGVEAGETFEEAAHREAREEAGVAVSITGVLAVDSHLQADRSLWVRVAYSATVGEDEVLKSVPDHDSLQARWLSKADLDRLPMRGDELQRFFALTEPGNPPGVG